MAQDMNFILRHPKDPSALLDITGAKDAYAVQVGGPSGTCRPAGPL
mgnify:CR=1 FL=1